MSEKNSYPLIDIGANLSHNSFSEDLDQVLETAKQCGIEHIMVTGTSVESSQASVKLANQYPDFLSCTAGIHPHAASTWDDSVLNLLEDICHGSSVKALGETGLDYFRDFSPRAKQQEAFAAQLALAVKLKMPVFLHQRDGHADFTSILRKYRDGLPCGVVHCFTGDEKELRDYLDLDMHIGITGWICDERRGQHLHEIIKLIPENRLLLETDAPYLLPRTIAPKPPSRRNVPANLVYVLETVSLCLGTEKKVIAERTTENARDFFRL